MQDIIVTKQENCRFLLLTLVFRCPFICHLFYYQINIKEQKWKDYYKKLNEKGKWKSTWKQGLKAESGNFFVLLHYILHEEKITGEVAEENWNMIDTLKKPYVNQIPRYSPSIAPNHMLIINVSMALCHPLVPQGSSPIENPKRNGVEKSATQYKRVIGETFKDYS